MVYDSARAMVAHFVGHLVKEPHRGLVETLPLSFIIAFVSVLLIPTRSMKKAMELAATYSLPKVSQTITMLGKIPTNHCQYRED